MARVLVPVLSAEEEWRTSGNHRYPRGRACLWIRLTCGHYPVQRMVQLGRDKTWVAPKKVRCDSCERGEPVEPVEPVER